MRECSVCGREFERYESLNPIYISKVQEQGRKSKPELLNPLEYSCPYCYAVDRDRMMVLFLKKLREFYLNRAPLIKVLEIAPSDAIKKYLYTNWGESLLYTADLYMDKVDYKVDIQKMDCINDEAFDIIVCSHVLEHIRDDRMAMKELHRVLNRSGVGIIIVPLNLYQEKTDEEWGLTPEENWKRFGQGDHVRSYNKQDFVRRLKDSGFGVHELDASYFSKEEFYQNALIDTSTLYLVYKDFELYSERDKVIKSFGKVHNIFWHNIKENVKGEANYWIDKCKIENGCLNIWGWAYFTSADSQKTRMKILLKDDKEKKFYGSDLIARDDIQNVFGDAEKNYLYSGVDVSVELNAFNCVFLKAELLLFNENSICEIPLNIEVDS